MMRKVACEVSWEFCYLGMGGKGVHDYVWRRVNGQCLILLNGDAAMRHLQVLR
jgi:hypothetical protein